MELSFGDLTKGLMSKWVSGIFNDWVIMRLDSDWICKVCEFVTGLLCEMVNRYLGDQVIVQNAVWTSWLMRRVSG